MATKKATAEAKSNIAFIKYWGNRDAELRLPQNDSLSMNLESLFTQTTVQFDEELGEDQVVIDEAEVEAHARQRVIKQLDRVRGLARITTKAHVASRGNFPQGTGLASSASGFAALTLAATNAASVEMDERALSVLTRHASGSACRSIPGGFVEWIASSSSEASYAFSIAPSEHWDLKDVVVITSREPKKVGSTEGHLAAAASPFYGDRLARLPARFHRTKRALMARDLAALGPEIETEAIELHFVAMTSRPPIFYWSPGMVQVIEGARAWREGGLPVYFTLDAGPNVHLVCEAQYADEVAAKARAMSLVDQVIVSGVGGPAKLLESHLF
jgi:diphosphomevalonate decarboxylase